MREGRGRPLSCSSMAVWSVLVLLLSQPCPIHATLGSMGFMSLKKVPGGFNAVVEEPVVKTTAISVSERLALPPPMDEKAGADDSSTKTTVTTTTTSTSRSKAASAAPTRVIFNNNPNLLYQGLIVATNTLGFVTSVVLSLLSSSSSPPKHYHVDLLGTGAFAVAAMPSLIHSWRHESSPAVALNAATSNVDRIRFTSLAVVLWAVKLASFLVCRLEVDHQGRDDRLTDIMANPSYCAGFWTFSTVWGVVCGLPYSMGLTSSSPGNPKLVKTGMGLFAAGWIIETLADYQKWVFKHAEPASDGGKRVEFCNVGLWSLSQHPNWFGNLLLWSGIFVANLSALIEQPTPQHQSKQQKTKKQAKASKKTTAASPSSLAESVQAKIKELQPKVKDVGMRLWGYRRVAVAFLGPLFMWRLFDQQATGAMLSDALESNREKYGYGSNSDYTDYIDGTPLIIPKQFSIKALEIKSSY